MRKLAFLFAATLIVLIAAVLVAPSFIDWNAYRPQIAAAVKDATGRDLSIDGDLRLAILPSPALSVERVRLANAPGASATDMIRLKALRMHVAAAPLLAGRIEVRSIALVEPVIELEILPGGRGNWELAAPIGGPAGVKGGADNAPSDAAASRDVRLDDVAIENGTLVIRNAASGQVERIEKVAGKFSADSLAGPFRTEGRAVAHGVPVSFTATLGRMEEGQPAGLSLRLAAEGAEAQFSGTLKPTAAGSEVQGRIKSSAGSLSKLTAALGGASLRGLAASQFNLEGRLVFAAGNLALNELTVQLGELRASGALSIDLAPQLRIDGALSFARIDLDQLLAAVAEPASSAQGATQAGATPAGAPQAGTALLTGTLPADIAAGLDLSVDAVAYRGGVVRQLRVNLAFDRGALALNQLTALLPGGSELSVIGRLAAEQAGQPGLRFDGALEIGSENLRLVLDWLKMAPVGVPADRLRKVDFKTNIAATSRQVQLTELDLRVDASRMTGALTFVPGARPALGARLAFDRVNLDAYHLPAPANQARPVAQGASVPVAPGIGMPGALTWDVLRAFDANVEIKAEQVTLERTPLNKVEIEAMLEQGRLTLTQVSVGDVVGAAAHLSGTVDARATQPSIDLNAELSARDPSRLLRLVGIAPMLSPERLGVLAFKARARGGPDNLRLDSDLIALGATVRLAGSVVAGSGTGGERFDMTLEARHPELTSLLAALAIDSKTAAKTLGPLDLRLHAKGTADAAEVSDLSIKAGNSDLAGRINLALSGARPRIDMNLRATVLDLDPFFPPEPSAGRQRAIAAPVPMAGQTGWSRAPIDLGIMKLVDAKAALTAGVLTARGYRLDKAEVQATLHDGALDVSRFTGALFGGSFDMKGRLGAAAPQTVGLELSTVIRDADIRQAARSAAQVEIVGGHLDADLTVTSRGASEAELIGGLTGSGKFAARDGAVDGFDLPGFSARLDGLDNAVAFVNLAQIALSGGRTPFRRLDGSFAVQQGVLRSDDIRLEGPSGAGRGKAVLDLPHQTIDARGEFHLSDHPKAPPVGIRLSGSLDRPQRSYELQDLQAYVLQRVGEAVLRRVLPNTGGASTGGPSTGGAGTPAPSAPAQAQPGSGSSSQQIRPEDVLRGLLKGMGNP